MVYNAADVSGALNSNPFTDLQGVSRETRDLAIITAPGDVSFKLGKLRDNLVGGQATQGAAIADMNAVDVFSLNATVKF